MDITHACRHCCVGRKVYRISLDLYNDQGILRPGVQRMKKFEFTCNHCGKKSFFDFYRFSHPDVILLLKRLDQQQNELIHLLNQLNNILNILTLKLINFFRF